MAEYKILFSGFGGQGVVLVGSVLAQAALSIGKHVAGMVSYGAEVRGGTANASVIISDEEIASPVIDKPDVVIALNQPSVDKFKNNIHDNGVLVVNTSLAKGGFKLPNATVLEIPATEIAQKLGNIKTANIVALGCLLKKMKIVPIENAMAAIDVAFNAKKELIEINKKALMKGVEFE